MRSTQDSFQDIISKILTQPNERRKILSSMSDENFFEIAPIIIAEIIKREIKKPVFFNIANILIARYREKKDELDFQVIYNSRLNIEGAICNSLKDLEKEPVEEGLLLYSSHLEKYMQAVAGQIHSDYDTQAQTADLNFLMQGIAAQDIFPRMQTLLDAYESLYESLKNRAKTDAVFFCMAEILKGEYISDERGNYWCKDPEHNSDKGFARKLFNFKLLISYLNFQELSSEICMEIYNFFAFVLIDEEAHKNILIRAGKSQDLLMEMPRAISLIVCSLIYKIIDVDNAVEMLRSTTRASIEDSGHQSHKWYVSCNIKKQAEIERQSSEILSTEATGHLLVILDSIYGSDLRNPNAIDLLNLRMISEVFANPQFLKHISFYNEALRAYLYETYNHQSEEFKIIVASLVWRKFFLHYQDGEHNGMKMMLEYIMRYQNASPLHINGCINCEQLDDEIESVLEELHSLKILGVSQDAASVWIRWYSHSIKILNNFRDQIIVTGIEQYLLETDLEQCNILRGFLNNILTFSDQEARFLISPRFKSFATSPMFSLQYVFDTMRDDSIRSIVLNPQNWNYLAKIHAHNRLTLQCLREIPEGYDTYFLEAYSKNTKIVSYISMSYALKLYEFDRKLFYSSSFISAYEEYESADSNVFISVFKAYRTNRIYKLFYENKLAHDLISNHGYTLLEVVEIMAFDFYYMSCLSRVYKIHPEFREIIIAQIKDNIDIAKERLGLIFQNIRFSKENGSGDFNKELICFILDEIIERKRRNPKTRSVAYLQDLGLFYRCLGNITVDVKAEQLISTFTHVYNKGVLLKSKILAILEYMSSSQYSKFYQCTNIFRLFDLELISDLYLSIQFFKSMHYDLEILYIVKHVLTHPEKRRVFIMMIQEKQGVEYIMSMINRNKPIHLQIAAILSDPNIEVKYECFKKGVPIDKKTSSNIDAIIEQQDLIGFLAGYKLDTRDIEGQIHKSNIQSEEAKRLHIFVSKIIDLNLNHHDIVISVLKMYATAHKNSFIFATSDVMVEWLKDGKKWDEIVCFAYNTNILNMKTNDQYCSK